MKIKTVFSVAVVVTAFTLGYLTFQAVRLIQSWVLSSVAVCEQNSASRNCSQQNDKPFKVNLPSQ